MSKNEVQRAVEQLKLDGYQVRFTHWRQTDGFGIRRYSRKVKWMFDNGELVSENEYFDFATPVSNGGKTQCSILLTYPFNEAGPDDTEELVTQAVTHCSKDDQFCYAQGRRISLARAIKDMEINLPYLDKAVYDPLRGELWSNTRNGLR